MVMVEVNVKTGEQLMKVGRIADAVHKKFDIQLLDGYGEETTRKLKTFKNLDALYKWVDELNDDRG